MFKPSSVSNSFFLTLNNQKNSFKIYVVCIWLVACLHVISIILNSAIPFGLLYGPLTFVAFRCAIGQKNFKLQLGLNGFLFLFAVFIYIVVKNNFSAARFSAALTHLYIPLYFAGMALSMFVYGLITLLQIKVDTAHRSFFSKLAIFNIFIATLIFAILIQKQFFPSFWFGFDMVLFITMLLGLCAIIIGLYLFQQAQIIKAEMGRATKKVISIANMENSDEFQEIMELFANPDIFCDASMSLTKLASLTEVPKHKLTTLFTAHYNKSFYQILATHRIQFAKDKLIADPNLKIQYLSEECGFNSKSSFNKYFKEFYGVTPKEFREKTSAERQEVGVC